MYDIIVKTELDLLQNTEFGMYGKVISFGDFFVQYSSYANYKIIHFMD